MGVRHPCVLHVAASGDERALDTLDRTMQVIAGQGVAQVLLALDDGRGDERTWPGAVAAEVRRLWCAGLSILGKAKALELELAHLVRERGVYAVHLHGVVPCLLGSRVLKGSLVPGRVLYSPHLTRTGLEWTSRLLGYLVRKQLSALDCAALATSLTEAQALSKLLNRSAEVLPYWVSQVFFATQRREDSRPSVVAEGYGAEAIDTVTRLCILLNGRGPRVPFSWLGVPEPGFRSRLQAAGIRLLDAAQDSQRAQALSRASAFIHIAVRDEFPFRVAQAMAAGLPCLVSDTAHHRALVRHGETGLVCTSERDFVEKLVYLLRNRAERCRIGEAARAEAERWFTVLQFRRAVLRAYGFTEGFTAARAPDAGAAAAGFVSSVSRAGTTTV